MKKPNKEKLRVQKNPMKKSVQEETTSLDSEDVEHESKKELVTLGGELSPDIVASEQNTIR